MVPVQVHWVGFAVDCFGSQSISVALCCFVVGFVAAFRFENPALWHGSYFSDSRHLEPEPEEQDYFVYWQVNEKLKSSQEFDLDLLADFRTTNVHSVCSVVCCFALH